MEARLRHNLDELLKVKGLRASDLSKITGIPKQTLSEWRAGLVPKSVVALKRVATAFGISLDELIFTSDLSERFTSDLALSDHSLKQTLDALAALSPAAIFASDMQGFCISATEASAQVLGRMPSELEGRPWIELIASDRHLALHEFWQNDAAGTHDTFFLHTDLSLRYCRLVRLPLSQHRSLLGVLAARDEATALIDERATFTLGEFCHDLAANFRKQKWTEACELKVETSASQEITTRRRGLSHLIFMTLNSFAGSVLQNSENNVIELNARVIDQHLMITIAAGAELDSPPAWPREMIDLLSLEVSDERTVNRSVVSFRLNLNEPSH